MTDPTYSKRCYSCRRVLQAALFNANRSTRDGLTKRCKACNSYTTRTKYKNTLGYVAKSKRQDDQIILPLMHQNKAVLEDWYLSIQSLTEFNLNFIGFNIDSGQEIEVILSNAPNTFRIQVTSKDKSVQAIEYVGLSVETCFNMVLEFLLKNFHRLEFDPLSMATAKSLYFK